MAVVVFLRGVNVGGHKTFRPAVLAKDLKRFDVVNIGAAGTFVVRKAVSRAELRAEIARRLPFETEVMMCSGKEILELAESDPFDGRSSKPDVVQFVSVMGRRSKQQVACPLQFPSEGAWGLRILACRDRFVIGEYKREMKAVSYLGKLDKLFGTPLTTRNWNTISSIVRLLTP